MLINTDDLAGIADLVKKFNIGHSGVHFWRQKPDFPEPLCVLAAGPLWSMATVQAWVDQHKVNRFKARATTVRLVPGGKYIPRGQPRWGVFKFRTWDMLYGPYTTRREAREFSEKHEEWVAHESSGRS